jgi:hypothetical protein
VPVYGEKTVRRAETVMTEIAVETRMALELFRLNYERLTA